MFFSRPKLLLLLKRQSLEIYFKDASQVLNIEFPPASIKHLEVSSKDELLKSLLDGFEKTGLQNQKAILVLSDQVIFERLISQKNPELVDSNINNFYEDIPLDEQHIAKKLIPLKGSILALACNRQIYQIIIEAASEFEFKIQAVIPLILYFKVSEKSTLAPEQVDQILSLGKEEESNFLKEDILVEKPLDKPADESKTESNSNLVITLGLVVVLASIIISSLIYFKIVTLPFNLPFLSSESPEQLLQPSKNLLQPETILEQNDASEAAVESSSSSEAKSDVKIHVLNGSGIAGQATKLEEKLEEIGFSNIVTGNIDRSEATNSSITYANDINQTIKEELNSLLGSIVENIEKVEEDLNEFDIVIILGKLNNPIE